MKQFCILASLLFLFVSRVLYGQTSWPEDLILTAEKSDFVKSSTYSDVITFLDNLKSKSPLMHVISMGKSLEGKEIPVAILGNPAIKTAEEAKASGKPVIYVQGIFMQGKWKVRKLL